MNLPVALPLALGLANWYQLYLTGFVGSVFTELIVDGIRNKPLDRLWTHTSLFGW
jgi:hypothetical protein